METMISETAVGNTALDARVASAHRLLAHIAADYAPAVFMTSFGAEDMVLFDLIAAHPDRAALKAISIATLDTGRLPDETYQLWQKSVDQYGRKVESYFPQAPKVEQFVRINGINAMYESVAQRKECCHIRKVEPLKRALSGKKAWITGLRRAQAVTRKDLPISEYDIDHGLEKFNPLADWSEQELWDYIRTRSVPYNALHDKGYPSIGCAPCTRAIQPGEDIRAGRWWWENADSKECGLHVRDPGEETVA